MALVSCGSLGFGQVSSAARELLATGPSVVPVVVCGRNERLARSLRRLADPRLRVLGWTGEMATWIVASDVVVTNEGGATGKRWPAAVPC